MTALSILEPALHKIGFIIVFSIIAGKKASEKKSKFCFGATIFKSLSFLIDDSESQTLLQRQSSDAKPLFSS